jgi:hypothetical protein
MTNAPHSVSKRSNFNIIRGRKLFYGWNGNGTPAHFKGISVTGREKIKDKSKRLFRLEIL